MAADPIGGIIAELSVDSKMEAGLEKARKAMDVLQSEARKLKQAMDDGTIGADAYMKRIQVLSASQKDLAAAMQSAYTRGAGATNALSVGMNGIAKSGMNAGQKMMIFGQVVDDAQYGMVALTNQAGQVAMALGLGAGIGGAVMATTVGVVQLTKHWHSFMDAIGVGTVETAAEEMARLGAATTLTAEQQERLNRLKSQEKTWTSYSEMKGKSAAAGEAAIREAIGSSPEGGPGIQKLVSGTLRGRMSRTEQEQQLIRDAEVRDKAIAKSRQSTGSDILGNIGQIGATALQAIRGNVEQVTKSVDEAVNRRAVDRAKELIDAMTEMAGTAKGEDARKTLLGILEQAGDAADPTGMLKEQIKASSPEAIKRKTDQEAQWNAQQKTLGIQDELNRRRQASLEEEATAKQNTLDIQAELNRRRSPAWQDEMSETNRGINEETDRRRAAFAKEEEERLKSLRPQNEAKVQAARDRLPGLGLAAEQEYTKLLGRSGGDVDASREELQRQLTERLQAAGMSPLAAQIEAKQQAESTARGVNEDIAAKAAAGSGRSSQIMDASQLNASVQASVTDQNSSLQVQKKMVDHLAKIKEWTDKFGMAAPVK